MSLYRTYLSALNNPSTPTLFMDEDQFTKNVNWVKENAGNKKIRIATKSIRSKNILNKILKSDKVFQGLMTYDLREALWLRDEGFKDILMGYPTMDKEALKILAEDPRDITLMVDLPEHLEIISEAARAKNNKINVCVDIDLSMDLPFVRFGVFRSRITSKKRIEDFVKELKKHPLISLHGLMGYEAQIAGVMDKESALMRTLKSLSLKQLQPKRKELVSYLESEGYNLSFVNGGGTGSLLETRTEECVTEITVGSGFYSPVLFDHYRDFKLNPALYFTLPVIRNPEQGIYTCFGGGYIASGELSAIKQPTPYLPEGAALLKHEGAGEVQTPFEYNGPERIAIGDSLILRHAKAGEVCERFTEIKNIKDGKVIETIPTYRGEGKTFV